MNFCRPHPARHRGKGNDIVVAFHIFLFLIFAIEEISPHTGNGKIFFPAVQGVTAVILPLYKVPALVKDELHGELVVLKGEELLSNSISPRFYS